MHRMSWFAALLGGISLVFSWMPVRAQQAVPRWEATECDFEVFDWGTPVECGDLIVMEDRADPTSGTISLAVAIFRSQNPDKAPDPVVYLEGGPGGNALESMGAYFDMIFGAFVEDRDFIIFDQRGTGYSKPQLTCPEYTSLLYDILDDPLTPAQRRDRVVQAFQTCHDRLVSRGVNLDAYNSAASAADLNDLRQVLGIPQWNLYGISYGTRLGLTVMRDYPDGIRSVILDSVYPPQSNLLQTAPNAQRAFDELFNACAQDAVCNASYPSLGLIFTNTVQMLNLSPAQVTITHPKFDRRYEVQVNGDLLVRIAFSMLYAEWRIPEVPQVIVEVFQGNYTLLGRVLASLLYDEEGFSTGMMMSVQCAEEAPFTTLEEYQASAATFPDLRGFMDDAPNLGEIFFRTCDFWSAPPVNPVENLPVASAIPTLVMAGQFDPITPPSWAADTARYLTRGYYYEYPGVGHGASLSGECPQTMALAFLNNPLVAPDSSCIPDMPRPIFTVVDKSITLVPFSDDYMGVSGLRPEAWEDYGGGVFVRPGGEDAALYNLIIGEVSTTRVMRLITEQFGISTTIQPVSTRTTPNGMLWSLYETEYNSLSYDFAISEAQGMTYLVMIHYPPNERSALYSSVFIPALEAFSVQ